MKFFIATAGAAALLAGCGETTDSAQAQQTQAQQTQAEDLQVDEAVVEAAGGEIDTVEEAEVAAATIAGADIADVSADQDISSLPAGLYTDEDGHAYIAFSYDHQGFSNPILRFNGDAFEARMDLVPNDPTATTLTVDLDPSMIDSGVGAFDDHLRSADFFDVEQFPEARFETTSLSMDSPTTGTLLGDLTLKDVTRPVALDVTLNKVGEHFRTGVPMFGVSATGKISRSDWGLGLYAPSVGDEVDLTIEVEFQKAEG